MNRDDIFGILFGTAILIIIAFILYAALFAIISVDDPAPTLCADKGMVSVKIAGESRCVDPRNLVKVK